ncbi:hypothetical protein Poli38472_013309 [Pythium oligandrum]|uniref:Uncharacterized protein n=1 Tax=Pythium oligandrum TaxID=41045 RepID=A0A8K1C2Z5_PYTOL|nr:hypothetical protein Poli38472_013309 [Pythium oligandrum]|eukprot:TMW55418.1 hypothetical protein Poli38472_013309 [Pythium oligandrum]
MIRGQPFHATRDPHDPWDASALPSDEETTHSRSHRHRSQSENVGAEFTPHAYDDTPSASGYGGGISIPANRAFRRFDQFLQGRNSPLSSDDEESDLQMYSTSYAGPRDLTNYTFQMVQMAGYLEKQSVKNPEVWKRRWFVMQESVLFYYRSEHDVRDKKPTDATCCGVIQLDAVDSVTTAKDFGGGAFQIRLPQRRYILRAETKELMHDWLFNFQKSIANIVSVLLRTKGDHRSNRYGKNLSRRSFTRVSRSVSFDFQDCGLDVGRMSADFAMHRFHSGFGDSLEYSDGSSSDNARTSPRRASSPIAYSHYGPRSPVAMFAFDPPFESFSEDTLHSDFYGTTDHPLIEGQEDEEDEEEKPIAAEPAGPSAGDSPALERTLSPPVSSGKYIPRFLRDRQNAVAAAPPPMLDSASPPTMRPSPPPLSMSWRLSQRSLEARSMSMSESEVMHFDDNVSYMTGSESHGVTSLKGVRKNLEDVCCCVPDLNSHLSQTTYAKHSLYALFDGHCGVKAATFLREKLIKYLCDHEAFLSNARQAFTDCFRRIDEEFLARAASELMSDGSTAAVVLIRGNKLLTANVGDSRAVVSVNGVALDVIEEQTPGRADERARIENLGGWVKEERELQMSKLHSMDLSDPWIQQKAERVVRWVNIYRVNGELAVSRAIGDIDYKGKTLMEYEFWAFPEGHDRKFHGDLVICDPEFKEIEITPEVRFLVLACDGLWDTITSQEAVDHVTEKLAEGYTTGQISHSLADLAIRSGSSDNVSVIVVLLQPY